jgi:hypothetical protein
MRAMGWRGSIVSAVAVAMLAWAATAGAAGTGRIEGTVTDEASNPLEGVTVCAQPVTAFVYGECAWHTDHDGRYVIENLGQGGYRVQFYVANNGSPLDFVPQWYFGKAYPEEGEIDSVTEGAATALTTVKMKPGGQILGTVSDRLTGLPVAGVDVCASRVAPPTQNGDLGYCDRTDGAGAYEIRNLGSAEYRVEFSTFEGPNYISEVRQASVTVVAGSPTTGIDAQLLPGLGFEGDAVDAATGLRPEILSPPYTGILVCAFEPITERRVSCVPLGLDGHYELVGLQTGTYVVGFAVDQFEDGLDLPDGYVRRYWNEAQNFSEATPLGSATPTLITGIDARLTRGAEILPPKPVVTPPAPVASPTTVLPTTSRIKCAKRGFRRKVVKGHERCVEIHRKRRHHKLHKPTHGGRHTWAQSEHRVPPRVR